MSLLAMLESQVRVLMCIGLEHDLRLVILAALLCLIGSTVAVKLFHRSVTATRLSGVYWAFLAAVTAGASTWATHFIAMLAYRPNVYATFDAHLTVVSALIAIVGISIGFFLATARNRTTAVLLGGGVVGLSIAAMHYVGMFAYRVDGIVRWLPEYIYASIALSVGLSAIAIDRIRAADGRDARLGLLSGPLLALAIVSLHFTGMAAFEVVPIAGVQQGADSEAFRAMASAIAMVALLIVAAGICTTLIERRTADETDARLRHLAHHDALTGIANRRAYENALRKECLKFERYGRPFALLTVDLDRFKAVNDTLGHPIGDVLLSRVAERLSEAVREGDLVARTGGDEFAVLSFGIENSEQAESVGRRIVEILSRPFVIHGNVADIGASVGLAVVPEHGRMPEELVQNADVALYSVKQNGKGALGLFEPSLNAKLQRRRTLEAGLRRALLRDDFEVHYQPIVDAPTGNITAAEALARWTCEELGSVGPDEFIPIAEEMGVVSRIGAFVMRQACKDAAKWPSHIKLAVNVSPVQLLDPRLPQTIRQALVDAGLPAERLEIEITETALVGHDDEAMRTLTELREMGIRTSLDDFGTGYSSLSYLHRFPINRVKIDKSFVQKLPEDKGAVSIVKGILHLAESLNLEVTAEGVENAEQLALVSGYRCQNVQGFYFSRPITREAFDEAVADKQEIEVTF